MYEAPNEICLGFDDVSGREQDRGGKTMFEREVSLWIWRVA